MIACSVIAQIAAHGRPTSTAQTVGLCLLAAGLILLAIAGAASSLALLLVSTAIAGLGQGLVFLAGITEVSSTAPPERRADVLSSFYVIVYLGVGLPVIGVGFLATTIGLLRSVQYFALAVAALCLALTATHAYRNRQRSGQPRRERTPRSLRVDQPAGCLDEDEGADAEQQHSVDHRGKDLRSLVPESARLAGRPAGEPHRQEGQPDPRGVGGHVPGIGDQHERMRQHSADDLCRQDRHRDPEHERQPAPLRTRRGRSTVIVTHQQCGSAVAAVRRSLSLRHGWSTSTASTTSARSRRACARFVSASW